MEFVASVDLLLAGNIAVVGALTDWARQAFLPQLGRRRRRPVVMRGAEALESRQLLTVTLGPVLSNDIPATKEGLVALPVTNTTSNPVTYSVQSSDPGVTATIVPGGHSLLLNIRGKDSNNVDFTGDLTFRLFDDSAPVTIAHIESLVNTDFYDLLSFHRVIAGFVAQGGDPLGNGTGGSGTRIPDEFTTSLTFTSQGLLAMANSGSDTGDSQFFITAVDEPLSLLPQHLNFKHTIFGILTGGFDTFRKLMSTPVDSSSKPLTKAEIVNATTFTDDQAGVLRIIPQAGFTGSTTLTVTADDGNGSTDQKSFAVNIVADTVNDRPFLGTVANQTTLQGTPITFTVSGTDLERDSLTFVVKDAASFSTATSIGTAPANVAVNIQVTPATSSNPAFATVTLTPSANFSGTSNLVIGVRDQTLRDGSNIDQKANFDTQAFTLTVTPVNRAPTAPGGSTTTPVGTAVNIQLQGDDGDADKTQTLTFEIVTQPSTGSISNFNASTGALTYTPAGGFNGAASFTYRVRDNGGTENGGQDTSALGTFTVQVGQQTVPTALALATASDDGLFNDDRVISNSTPRFTVTAAAGSTVVFRVNNQTDVTATETSAGNFSAQLTPAMLQVGANTITATATLNGATSNATDPLTFTYAPDNSQIYTVPGAVGTSQQITFEYVARNASFRSEFGLFLVDAGGSVNGIAPGSSGYQSAALSSATRQTIFAAGTGAGAKQTVTLAAGQQVAFYLAVNGTAAQLAGGNSSNGAFGANAFFTVNGANADGFDHVHIQGDSQTGRELLYWEDMRGGGDRDYNDVVIGVRRASEAPVSAAEPFRVPGGASHNVNVGFQLQGAQNTLPAGVANGEFGVFFVSDAGGTVNGIAPGATGYLQAALSSSTRQVLFQQGDTLGTNKTLSLVGGSLVGWYYIPEGTTADVLEDNPTNDPAKTPLVYFSFDSANPNAARHFRWFGPERGGSTRSTSDGNGELLMHINGDLNPSESTFDDYLIAITLPG